MANKTRLLNVTLVHNVPTIYEALGMTKERADEITNMIRGWVDGSFKEGTADGSRIIEKCLDAFTEPQDLVCALFTLQPTVANEMQKEIMGGNDDENKELADLEKELGIQD